MSGQLGGPGEVERRQAGARLSGLQVLLQRVRQAVGLRAVTQLSTGLVDLEGVAHRYAPHLQWRICVQCSLTDRSHLWRLLKLLLQRRPDVEKLKVILSR